MNLTALARYLELTAQELKDAGISRVDIQEDPRNTGDLINNYYFHAPDETPQYIYLAKKVVYRGTNIFPRRNP